jgi:hypothetical protein
MAAKTVEKWAAGFYSDQLHVAKGHFKETKKQLRREGGSHADEVDRALGFGHTYPRDTDLLHDTQEEALDALHAREFAEILILQSKIGRAQSRMNLIDDFEVQK